MKKIKPILFVFLIFSFACSREQEWIQLFNGKDLNDWNIKIRGFELNDNHLNTFFVEDGILKVSYDNYESFDRKFGHIFYNVPFSSYKLRVEYRFTGEQSKNGPGWAYRNNGIMIHSQSPESMDINQDFPVSVEVQLLGGDGETERSNANVCTPGTLVDIDGVTIEGHCANSRSLTYHGDQWVTIEVVVYEDSIVHHILDGDTVFSYTNLRTTTGSESRVQENPLKQGYIALQSESHPTEFRKVELLRLKKE